MAMTLQELLALLPDNTTGDIGADDLRTIVTELFNTGAATADQVSEDIEEITEINTRLDALEAASGGSGVDTVTVQGRWQYNPQAGAPGGAQMTTDTGDPLTVTALRFAPHDHDDRDFTTNIENLTAGDVIYVQGWQVSGSRASFDVTGDGVATGGYLEVPVTRRTGSGDSSATWQDVAVIFRGGAQ
jgi:hypothetical protein